MTRKALGRGLKALIPDNKKTPKSALDELEVNRISPGPNQPRSEFDAERLQELALSIKAQGIIQPLVVQPAGDDTYTLIAGERRWRAAREAGLKKVPVVIKSVSPAQALEMALIENVQREDLNAIEEARAYQHLIDSFDLTQEDVARQVGKDRSSIANHLRLLRLPDKIQQDVAEGALSMGHARAILSLQGKEKQLLARKTILSRDLSVRETEKLVRRLASPEAKTKTRKSIKTIFIMDLENSLRRALGTKVAIRPSGRKGAIEIQYYSEEDLNRLSEFILREETS